VVGHRLSNGSTVYLGLSSDYEMAVIHRLRMEFLALWLALAGLGILIAYWTARQTLERVEAITEAAAGIDRRSLDVRVPVGRHDDEIARLAKTFNQMLDRVQRAVRQLHTMTDSLAHDLRSPLTSIRGRLELALLAAEEQAQTPGPGLASARAASHDNLAAVVEEIDPLCTLLDNSLDLADANADALRLRLSEFDLDAMLRSLVELYEPALAQGGKTIRVDSRGPLLLTADPSLVERVLMNLLDNALKHLPAGTEIVCSLEGEGAAALLCFKDNGPGFRPETARERRNRPGPSPPGRGMGLAFIVAVVESHDGTVQFPAVERGSRIEIRLPLRPLRPGEPAGRAPAREPQQAT
jgi:signal transduction histidine kinase